MSAKTPIRATFTGSEVSGLAEYQSGEFIDLSHGGLGASLSIGTTGQVLKVNSSGTALEFGNVEAVINIDTANDLTGSTLVSSDQILLSDGGTEGRVTLSQLDTLFSGTTQTLTNKTFDANGTGNSLSNVEVADFAGSAIVIESEGIGSNDNDTTIPTSAAVKDYVDSQVTAQDLDFQGDSGGALSIDLDSETLTIAGGTGINTSGATNTLTVGIDNTVVATLSDTQTLTNKTINLSSNTLTGTTAQFNTALSDGSFATLAGTETLTNKTLTSPVIAEITSGADIDLTATNDVNIPANVGLTFGDDGEKIEGNGTDLTISSSGFINVNASSDIKLNAAGNDVRLYSSATEFLRLTHSTGDAVIHSIVSDKDIIFKGNDGGSTITALTLDMSEAGNATFNNNVTVGNDLTVTGDLTVNGTTTTVNSTTLTVDDKNIELGSTASPTDTSADGGGITLKGTTDKTFNWVDSTDSWTSSEHLDLASGKEFKINSSTVLTSSQVLGKSLPSGDVVGSSDTQILTNKTIDASSNTISNIGNSQLTSGIDAAKISSGSVSNTEFDYLNGVTSNIQTQLDDKASKGFAIAMAIAL